MNSDCRQMIDVCKPRVYHDNIFHLTGLPVDASSRDIARRQDDLKAAEVSGDWETEFHHFERGSEIPTAENIRNAFVLMQEPERRFVEEFFWFWPLEWGSGKKDPAFQHYVAGYWPKAIEIWQAQQFAPGRMKIVSQHNLAVYCHFLAISREISVLSGAKLASADLQQMTDWWRPALSYWESLADDDGFWGIVSERVRLVNDPRLTTGFVRRMRQAFPVAFDQINAHLALEYAKMGRYSDSRRHVIYMKESHKGLDDVEQTVIEIFEPMEKRVGRMVDFAAEAAKKDPANGLKSAQDLLDSSKESLEVAKGLLDDGHSMRTQLFDLVATTCFGCLIAYGNKTSDWKPCIDLLKKVEQLAVTEDFKKRVRENLDIATQNHETKILHETCWVCKKNKAEAVSTLELQMYGEVSSEFNFGKFSSSNNGSGKKCVWKRITIKIPRCRKCASFYRSIDPHNCTYLPFKDLWEKGWKCGEEPTDDEMRKACGLKTQTEEQLLKFFSLSVYIGIILLIYGICSLCGC